METGCKVLFFITADALFLDLALCILHSNNHVFFTASELHSKEKAIYEQRCLLPATLSVIYKCLF